MTNSFINIKLVHLSLNLMDKSTFYKTIRHFYFILYIYHILE